MKSMNIRIAVMISILWVVNASAYEVWMGTHLATKAMATTDLSEWSITAPQLEGYNIIRAPHDTDPASTADWKTVFSQFTYARQSGIEMTEIARSEVTKIPDKVDALAFPYIDSTLTGFFNAENTYDYDLDYIMFYDNATTYPGDGQVYNYNWTITEVQYMRDWLDSNGHADVELLWNARSNSQFNKDWSTNSLVDHVMIEGATTQFLNNQYGKRSMIEWLWSEPATTNKRVVLQIPRALPEDTYNQYEGTRRMAVDLGQRLGYGEDGIRSDRLVLELVTYNDNYPYYPETESNGTLYKNSLTSICLSLIEQRDLFEGRLSSLPTNADADSYVRAAPVDPPPSSGMAAHWPLDEGTGTNAADESGYDQPGTLLNGATWDSDATRDSYVVFDGTDDRIATTFTYALADTNDFTWAWWAKMEPASHPSSIMVGNRYGNTGSETYEFIKMMPSKASFANTDSTGSIENYDYVDIAASSWHHYAMVKDGTSYQWYVDGVAQGVASNFVYSESTPLPFLIGGDDNGTAKPNEHFQGCIDDVVLYREALSSAELLDVQNGDYPYAPPVYELIAGWDTWDSSTAPSASVLASNVTASAVTTVEEQSWNVTDERGASNDGDWGTFAGVPSASIVTNADNENLTLVDAATGGAIVFAVTNNGTDNIELGSVHFDAYAFRPKAPRTYALSVLAGSGITTGIVFTSASDAITEVGGANDNGAHDDIDIILTGLADRTLGPGESVQFELAFSGGAGDDSGGHHLFVDNLGLTGEFIEYIAPPVIDLIAGWDTWDSSTAPSASVLAPNITGTAVTTTESNNWNVVDERGASNDGDWGTFVTIPSASIVTNADNENLTLPNATTGGTITFTVVNNGSGDIELNAFHFDAYAFRPKAPRTYELSVLAGGGISDGVVFTSAADAIPDVGGENDNGAHDDIDIALDGLADTTLGVGESVQFLLAFSGGLGDDSGGHHLFVDNVGVSGVLPTVTEPPESPVLDHSMSGSDMVFSWTGTGFKVQSRTNLTAGIWNDVPGGDIPPVTNSPVYPEEFFRLIDQ